MQRFKRHKLSEVLIAAGLLLTIILVSYFLIYQNQVQPRQYNILLITVDALRPDHLGCYGYKRNTSSNIDNLAKEGVIFTQAITQGTNTIPSLPSLMTSLYPSQHGVKKIFTKYFLLVPTLAEILKLNGYHTTGFVAHTLRHTGITRGFDSIDFSRGVKANAITQKAVDWLYKNKDKRFFLWLHFIDPHAPYLPPYPYNELFLPTEFREKGKEFLTEKYNWISFPQNISRPSVRRPAPPRFIENHKDFFVKDFPPYPVCPKQSLDKTLTGEDREYYVSQYDGEIKFTDDQIGILFDELKRLGLDQQTIVILTADHGENLADYNLYFFHGDALYDVLSKVPLIIKGGRLPKHKMIKRQVQLIDIMPTIFDILRIKKDIKMEGESLLPLIFNKKSRIRNYAFSEIFGILNVKSIRTENWKLIYYLDDGRYELYNLKSDPYEEYNLVNSEKKKFKFLKAKLEKWMRKTKPKTLPLARPLDEETKQELQSLGYVQ